MSSKRSIKQEISIVLLLSLGASAIYSVLSLIESATSKAGLAGTSSNLNPSENNAELWDFTYRVVGLTLGFVPVALVLFLLAQNYTNPLKAIGLWPPVSKDWIRGVAVFACIAIPGLLLYVTARGLSLAARIVPGEFQYWWLIPVLMISALKAALTEEVIMIGYLFKRFDEIGISSRWQQFISAGIRSCYHAYQGLAGVIGNFIMGLVFGWAYRRWGRVLPLVIAHFLLDAFSFVGYALLAKQLATFGGLF